MFVMRTKLMRNLALLVCLALAPMALGEQPYFVVTVSAEALYCDPEFPVEMNEECYTHPTQHCENTLEHPEGPFAVFCDQNEEDTCSAFCGGSGNVVGSLCDNDGGEHYLGAHQACVYDVWIWCKCTEVEEP